jgi:hypothetical protein
MTARHVVIAGSILPVLLSTQPSRAWNSITHVGHQHSAAERAAFLQTPGAQAPNGWKALPKMPPAVKGSENPELISDDIAYRHFIKATAYTTSAEQLERRHFFLARARLDPADRNAYTNAVGRVATEIDEVARQRQTGAGLLPQATLQSLKGTEDEAFASARRRIRAALSPQGVARLDAHINEYIKPRISLYSWSMK